MAAISPLVLRALVEHAYAHSPKETTAGLARKIAAGLASESGGQTDLVRARTAHPAAAVTPIQIQALVERTLKEAVLRRRHDDAPLEDEVQSPEIAIPYHVPVVAHSDEVDGILSPYDVKVVIKRVTEQTAEGRTFFVLEMMGYMPFGVIQWPSGCTCAALAHDETNTNCAAGHQTADGWPSGPCVYGRIGRRPVPAVLQADNKVVKDNISMYVTRVVPSDMPGRARVFAQVVPADIRLQKYAHLLDGYRDYTRPPATYKALLLGTGKIWKTARLPVDGQYSYLAQDSVISRVHVQLPGVYPGLLWPPYCVCETPAHRDNSMCPASNPDQTAEVAPPYRELWPHVNSVTQLVMLGSPTYSLFGLENDHEAYDPFQPSRQCAILDARGGRKDNTVIVDLVLLQQ